MLSNYYILVMFSILISSGFWVLILVFLFLLYILSIHLVGYYWNCDFYLSDFLFSDLC